MDAAPEGIRRFVTSTPLHLLRLHPAWPWSERARLPAVSSVSACAALCTRFCAASTSRSIFFASAYFPWPEREVATLLAAASVLRSSNPSTRYSTVSNLRYIISASLHLPCSSRTVAIMEAASCHFWSSLSPLHTLDQRACARPSCIAPVNSCWHVWHSGCHAQPPFSGACDSRQPSLGTPRASALRRRGTRTQTESSKAAAAAFARLKWRSSPAPALLFHTFSCASALPADCLRDLSRSLPSAAGMSPSSFSKSSREDRPRSERVKRVIRCRCAPVE